MIQTLTMVSLWAAWVAASNTTQIPTPTPTPTPTTSSGIGDQCHNLSQCQLVATAALICPTNDLAQCLCPPVVSAGPACSQCWLALNTTNAIILGDAITSCVSLFPSLTPGPTLTGTTFQSAPTPTDVCVSQCSLILQANTACGTNDSCFCPPWVEQGEQCYSCFITAAGLTLSAVPEAVSNCQAFAFTASNANITHTTISRSGSVTFNNVPTSGLISTTTIKSDAGHTRLKVRSFGIEIIGLVGLVSGILVGFIS